jgi:RNase P subunit RPR2
MPKCLDCNNIVRFSYREDSYNEAEYNAAGDLVDVVHKEYMDVVMGQCLECHSENIEGKL